MRLSRAVSSAMAPPPPLPRGSGGGREGPRRAGGQRGVPPARARSRPRRPSWAPSHLPGSGPSADTAEKKAEGNGSARICLGHVEAGVDGCRREPESTARAQPPGPCAGGVGGASDSRIQMRTARPPPAPPRQLSPAPQPSWHARRRWGRRGVRP